MDKFLEFVGASVAPWIIGIFIILAIFLLSWFLLSEIFGPKIRQEVRQRAKRIKKIRKIREQKESTKKYLMARLLEAGWRKIYKPKPE